MAAHNINPVREQLRGEMLKALSNCREPMTTGAIYEQCPSAVDAREVARLAYEMKKSGIIADGGKVLHQLGMKVNSYVMASDPRFEAAKPIVVERKIPKTGKSNKPRASNPYAKFTVSKPQEEAPRVTRGLPLHLQSAAPIAADELGEKISPNAPTPDQDPIMSEEPVPYITDPDAFSLEPEEPEDIDSELIDLLAMAHLEPKYPEADALLAKMVPLPQADDDDDVLAMASSDVSEIAAAMGNRQTATTGCQCLRINRLPPLPQGYVYGGIKVWIENEHDVGHLTITTHEEGGGAFASLKASGRLSFDSGELVMIGQVADELIRLHESMYKQNNVDSPWE